MEPLRVAVLGCGFWSRFQLAAWHELPDVRCIAVCDPDEAKARMAAEAWTEGRFFTDAERLLAEVVPDVVDVITPPHTHPDLVGLCARHRIPVICQKPMANELSTAQEMVNGCRQAGIPLFVHENWRWQRPIRELKAVLDRGAIGAPFRARLDFNSSFPVFTNQPFLAELERFILTDVGSHLLDVARFLFGEARRLNAVTQRIRPGIRGEDVATVLLEMRSGVTVTCNLSYASRTEHERFPETFIFVEGTEGSAELAPDLWVRLTDEAGTHSYRVQPPFYSWADPRYALLHASIVDCHRNLANGLRGQGAGETTGEDNLKTLQLVYGSYESAARGKSIAFTPLE
ncbi:MAG TPA: Gfo/Idh/MocA family oxidoreductase [Chthoniobacterales bacterium]